MHLLLNDKVITRRAFLKFELNFNARVDLWLLISRIV